MTSTLRWLFEKGRVGCTSFGLLVALAMPLSAIAEDFDLSGSSVRLTRVGGFSPFLSIEYVIILRGETPVARHSKSLVNYNDHLSKMALMTRSEYATLLGKLDALGVMALADSPGECDLRVHPRFELIMAFGGQTHQFTYCGHPDPRAGAQARVVSAITRAVV